MRVRNPFMAQGPDQLTVPGGAMVFLFGEEDRDGMATIIFDGEVRREDGGGRIVCVCCVCVFNGGVS